MSAPVMRPMVDAEDEAFWARVLIRGPGECWDWQGGCNRNGYGQVRKNGILYRANRYAYELAHGPLPTGLHCLHTCDRPVCVNPVHLFAGTVLENMRDRDRKGRHGCLRGEKHPQHRLTIQKVRRIRKLWATGKYQQRELARMFGVCQRTIVVIIHNLGWRESA